jgi:hypothetical protein
MVVVTEMVAVLVLGGGEGNGLDRRTVDLSSEMPVMGAV